MAKFRMMDILNESSRKGRDDESFRIKTIDIEYITPDERNFYSTDDIEELKASIEMIGLQQNLVVKEIGDGKYSLISGHRRLKAMKSLVESGQEKYRQVPCKVEIKIDDMMSELQLIMANSTMRELTDYEKTHQASKIKGLLTDMKNKGVKIPGKLRDIVADTLNISSTQVARMESISKNLSDEFKEEFKDGKVNISTAYELSGLPKEKQEEAYGDYEEKGDISIKDVRKLKETKKNEEQKTLEGDNAEMGEDEGSLNKERLKIYVCSSRGKRFGIAEYISAVVEQGHIPLNAQTIMWGTSGLKAEEAIRLLTIELIEIADEVWLFEGPTDENLAYTTMVELNIANNLGRKVVHHRPEEE